jgi:hypothetical protein
MEYPHFFLIKFGDWKKKDSPYISLPKGSIVVPLNNNQSID